MKMVQILIKSILLPVNSEVLVHLKNIESPGLYNSTKLLLVKIMFFTSITNSNDLKFKFYIYLKTYQYFNLKTGVYNLTILLFTAEQIHQ